MDEKARSRIMRAIRKKDTQPELTVRRLLHAMGYRFRLHRHDPPGTPDIVLPRVKAAIQVHGCFWHQHPESAEGQDARPDASADGCPRHEAGRHLRKRRANLLRSALERTRCPDAVQAALGEALSDPQSDPPPLGHYRPALHP